MSDFTSSPAARRSSAGNPAGSGSSELGAPLLWFPAPQADSRSGLIIAGTHGDENSSIVTPLLRPAHPETRATPPPRGADGQSLTAVSSGCAPMPAALTSTVTFQQPTGSKGKRFTAGIARRRSATWCC